MRITHNAGKLPLLVLMVAGLFAAPLVAQQAKPRVANTTSSAAPAAATASKPSPVYGSEASKPGTIAEAQAADAAANSSGATINLSEGALILVIVVLLILIIA